MVARGVAKKGNLITGIRGGQFVVDGVYLGMGIRGQKTQSQIDSDESRRARNQYNFGCHRMNRLDTRLFTTGNDLIFPFHHFLFLYVHSFKKKSQ
jgi:hypothetical protein